MGVVFRLGPEISSKFEIKHIKWLRSKAMLAIGYRDRSTLVNEFCSVGIAQMNELGG